MIKKIKKISDQSIQAVKICKIKEDDLEMRNNVNENSNNKIILFIDFKRVSQ